MANSLQTLRMTDATTGDQIDNKISELETAIGDILGIPRDILINNSGFLFDATGLKKVVVQDNAADPAAVGELARNGKVLKFHDGGVCAVPISIAGAVTEPTITNTAIQTAVYSTPIRGGTLGSTGMLQGHCDLFVNSILAGGVLEIRTIYGSQLIIGIQMTNNTGSQQLAFPIRLDFRLGARNSTAAQRTMQTSSIGTQLSTLSWGGVPSFWNHHGTTFLTIDSTVDQAFHVDVIWNSASINNSINGEGFEIHRIV